MTQVETLRNQRAYDHAIAQQKLEGLALPQEALADLQRVAKGEMSTADALSAARSRFTHDQIL